MRIRRRPQAQQQQALPPYPLPSDPFTAPHPPPPPPPNAEERHWLPLPGDEAEQGKKRRIESEVELHPLRPDADPGPAALPSGPQVGNVVVAGRSSSDDDDPPVHNHGGGAQRQGAAGRTHERYVIRCDDDEPKASRVSVTGLRGSVRWRESWPTNRPMILYWLRQ
uniref:Uncharacterized protein n=1 Tax=Aegilops tauschii subsp. strangulata TaxID=200361 RepID=A0A453PNU2_AEGTS